jgi:hypothetical protein
MLKLELKSHVPSDVGYSCQTLIARQVNEFLHPGEFYCWFSIKFNPSSGGNSSNPCWLYQTLSHAVEKDDRNDSKIKDVQTTLMDVISRELASQGATTQAINNAIVQIRNAEIQLFHPEIWRVFTKNLGSRVSDKHQYPEERKIEDLKWPEFDIIIE